MKKILSIMLSIIAIFMFVGCGEGKTPNDFKTLYESTKSIGKDELENSYLFSDKTKPNTISIYYPDNIASVVNLGFSDGNIKNKCYMALSIQQQVLTNIFKFYEEHNATFYKNISSKEYEDNEMNALYEKLNNLNKCLKDFEMVYEDFVLTASNEGVADVMNAKIKIYSYELNKVIDKSFDFMYEFINVYNKYCVENKDKLNMDYLDYSLDKTLVDMSYIIYLENIKSFNYSASENGTCEVFNIVETNSLYDLIPFLLDFELSEEVKANIISENNLYNKTKKNIEEYFYFNEIFEQKLISYKNVYNEMDIYEYNNYRMKLVNGVTYDNYLNSLTQSKLSNITLMENFIDITFFELMEKVNILVI